MSDKISGKFHPIPSTIANQRWISICNIIIYLETKFRPNRRIFVFAGHFIPWLPWQRPPFWICSTPQKLSHTTVDIPTKWIIIWLPNHGYRFPTSKSTWKPNFAQIGGVLYFGGHFGFKMAPIANKRWKSIRNIIIYLETKFRSNRRIFVFWWPFWIQNGRHSKPTMNINTVVSNHVNSEHVPSISFFDSLNKSAGDFRCLRYYCDNVSIS